MRRGSEGRDEEVLLRELYELEPSAESGDGAADAGGEAAGAGAAADAGGGAPSAGAEVIEVE